MLQLVKNKPNGILVCDMNNGDIAVIVAWTRAEYIGYIVQRYGDALITLGKPEGQRWPDCFRPGQLTPSCRVRILGKGEMLVVI